MTDWADKKAKYLWSFTTSSISLSEMAHQLRQARVEGMRVAEEAVIGINGDFDEDTIEQFADAIRDAIDKELRQ